MATLAYQLAMEYFNKIKWFCKDRGAVVAAAARSYENLIKELKYADLFEALNFFSLTRGTWQLNAVQDPSETVLTPADNLIDKGTFYFHPVLQIAPPAPIWYPDGPQIEQEPFYLTNVEVFTMGHLVTYFSERTNQMLTPLANNAYSKTLRYIFGRIPNLRQPLNKLDAVLYTIDEAVTQTYDKGDKPIREVIELVNYIPDGIEIYEARYNSSVEYGLDKPILPTR